MILKPKELFGIFVEKYDREHLRHREVGKRKKAKLNTQGKEETFYTERKYLPSSEQMIASALRTERGKDGEREGQGSRLRFLPADAPPDEHLRTLRTHGCN